MAFPSSVFDAVPAMIDSSGVLTLSLRSQSREKLGLFDSLNQWAVYERRGKFGGSVNSTHYLLE